MASLTRWTWVWASSGSWRWTGKPGMLQSMGSQRVGHDWATELNWTIMIYFGIQIVSDFAIGAISGWYLCPFDLFPSLFEYVLLFGTRCSWLILFFPCSRPDLHGALVSFIGEWNLETRSKCWICGYICLSSIRLSCLRSEIGYLFIFEWHMPSPMSVTQSVFNNLWLFSRSVVSDSFVTLWTVAHQASLSVGFHRQEYWSRLPVPSPGDLPDPGIKPVSLASQAVSLLLSHSEFSFSKYLLENKVARYLEPLSMFLLDPWNRP